MIGLARRRRPLVFILGILKLLTLFLGLGALLSSCLFLHLGSFLAVDYILRRDEAKVDRIVGCKYCSARVVYLTALGVYLGLDGYLLHYLLFIVIIVNDLQYNEPYGNNYCHCSKETQHKSRSGI